MSCKEASVYADVDKDVCRDIWTTSDIYSVSARKVL